jgi:hypothetical protein
LTPPRRARAALRRSAARHRVAATLDERAAGPVHGAAQLGIAKGAGGVLAEAVAGDLHASASPRTGSGCSLHALPQQLGDVRGAHARARTARAAGELHQTAGVGRGEHLRAGGDDALVLRRAIALDTSGIFTAKSPPKPQQTSCVVGLDELGSGGPQQPARRLADAHQRSAWQESW